MSGPPSTQLFQIQYPHHWKVGCTEDPDLAKAVKEGTIPLFPENQVCMWKVEEIPVDEIDITKEDGGVETPTISGPRTTSGCKYISSIIGKGDGEGLTVF